MDGAITFLGSWKDTCPVAIDAFLSRFDHGVYITVTLSFLFPACMKFSINPPPSRTFATSHIEREREGKEAPSIEFALVNCAQSSTSFSGSASHFCSGVRRRYICAEERLSAWNYRRRGGLSVSRSLSITVLIRSLEGRGWETYPSIMS